ncbi:tim44-like domain-containing protein [Apiospora rasikravindrae]|uniref:Tim44-like domain-containing protein n=1 Tax=Apiospora rasikravindrae TaxID=990691 RepID=A0ABR1S1K8_9PEZI
MATKQFTRLLQPSLRASIPTYRTTAPTLRLTYSSISSGSRSSRICAATTTCSSVTRGFRTMSSPLRAKAVPKYNRYKKHEDSSSRSLELGMENVTFLLPQTLVAPPLSRYPRSPAKFLQMAWIANFSRVWNYASLLLFKIASKPDWKTRPRFKVRRGVILPTAKALHLEMNEALARGDKETLRRICTNEFYQKLAGIIDARPRGHRAEWELVKYRSSFTYPCIAEDKIGLMPTPSGIQKAYRQAIVSIASIQRMVRHVPNQAKPVVTEKPMLEHLVLSSQVDHTDTYGQTPWKVWGTLQESTLESYLETKEVEEWMAKNPQRPGQ